MKSSTSKSPFLSALAVAILLCALSDAFAESRGSIKLNEDASVFAARLIREGHVITDGKGAWSKHQPSADAENQFIRLYGFAEYAKWHLGLDDRYPENTKARYKFPYGDFKSLHRCGLLAAKARAHQYKYSTIDDAATRLIEMIRQRK